MVNRPASHPSDQVEPLAKILGSDEGKRTAKAELKFEKDTSVDLMKWTSARNIDSNISHSEVFVCISVQSWRYVSTHWVLSTVQQQSRQTKLSALLGDTRSYLPSARKHQTNDEADFGYQLEGSVWDKGDASEADQLWPLAVRQSKKLLSIVRFWRRRLVLLITKLLPVAATLFLAVSLLTFGNSRALFSKHSH